MKRPVYALLTMLALLAAMACPACASVPVDATPAERAAIVEGNFADLSAFLDDAEDSYLDYVAVRAPEDLDRQTALVESVRDLVETAHASWQRTGDYDLTDLRNVLASIADGYERYVETDEGLDEDGKLRRLVLIRLGRTAGRALLSRFESAGIQHEPDVPIEQLALACVAEHTLSRTVMASACSARGGDHSRVLDVGDPGGDRLAAAGVRCDWHL